MQASKQQAHSHATSPPSASSRPPPKPNNVTGFRNNPQTRTQPASQPASQTSLENSRRRVPGRLAPESSRFSAAVMRCACGAWRQTDPPGQKTHCCSAPEKGPFLARESLLPLRRDGGRPAPGGPVRRGDPVRENGGLLV